MQLGLEQCLIKAMSKFMNYDHNKGVSLASIIGHYRFVSAIKNLAYLL